MFLMAYVDGVIRVRAEKKLTVSVEGHRWVES